MTQKHKPPAAPASDGPSAIQTATGTESDTAQYAALLRRAAVEISLAAEKERRAIAGEVHDNIGQELAIAKLRLSHLCDDAEGELLTELCEIRARIGVAMEACRLLNHDLATPALYRLGLISALKNLICDYRNTHQLAVNASFSTDHVALPQTTTIILYRVIRELLINVLKHARANQVSLDLSHSNESITLTIVDDGMGFDVSKTLNSFEPETGLGLFLVRERLWHIGGTFDIQSAPGKGTWTTLVVPRNGAADSVEMQT